MRVAQEAETERGLGGDMDDLWGEGVDRAVDSGKGRQREVKFRVKRGRSRAHQERVRRRDFAVVGVDELHKVAPLGEVADELPERARHAVNLGEVRFRDQTDSHRSGPLPCSRRARGWTRLAMLRAGSR